MRFAVVGDPIGHSRSPAIHTAAFAALGIDATYEARRVPFTGFDDVVADLRSGALDGVNVTMPHKEHAYDAATTASDGALRTRAVNTLVARDGALAGHNTDIDGVRHAIAALGDVDAPRLVVLGSGGAARAAVVAADGPVAVMARSPDRAVEVLRTTGTSGDVLAWGDEVHGAIVVNATPLGMRGELLPEAVLSTSSAVVDMVYGDTSTPTIQWAGRTGLPSVDGIVMLVGQAARAFELFVGRTAPMEVMDRAARGSVPGSRPGPP